MAVMVPMAVWDEHLEVFLLALPLLVALVWLALAWTTRREMTTMPRLVGVAPRSDLRPFVLAIIPARDEAEVVSTCLKALLAQQHIHLLAVLYDDRSRDGTPRLCEDIAAHSDGRLLVVRGSEEPPTGWCGKTHALHQALLHVGYDVTEGRMHDGRIPDALLFLDADVILRPTAAAELVAVLRARGAGLASALPRLVCRTFWENVAGPSVGGLVTARHRPSRVNRMRDPAVLANGQFMAITPRAYADVGGHERVRGDVLEDVAIARHIKTAGHPIVLADGQRVMSTRMYASFGELWQGWLKNAFLLAGGTAKHALGYGLVALLLSVTPLVCLAASTSLLSSGDRIPATAFAAGYLVPLAIQMLLRRAAGQNVRYAFFAPLGAVLVAALLVTATIIALRRKPVTWKGRAYVGHDGR